MTHSHRPSSLPAPRARAKSSSHPILSLVGRRLALGVVTLFLVSIVIFAATQVLPGNAAYAVLGPARDARPGGGAGEAAPPRPARGRAVLGLDLRRAQGRPRQVASPTATPVSHLVGPRIANSAVLVLLAGVIGTVIGVGAGHAGGGAP